MDPNGILIGLGEDKVYLNPRYANRHGLIAGATGTGKTVTLQVLAEGFSALGVPVFMADIKGDLTGISRPGTLNAKVQERLEKIGIEGYRNEGFPVVLWDVFGEMGHPVRATVSEMGPLLLSRLMELNETQEGVLNIAFRYADDQNLLLLDLKDLRSIVQFVGENADKFTTAYGNVSPASIGAIQRRLLVLEQQGADRFFGEPALELEDFMRVDRTGYGQINILAADKLMNAPRLYATFLLWLLSELFENLPEAGDLDKPKLVFFFDEAHLLFDDAPKALIDKVEQVVRLIRSKGVGVYFVTQNPLDVPDEVLAQLGNRVQHALRAFTPRDQKAVRTAAETFRVNPKLDTATVIMEMGVGEALVSVLEGKGTPSIVQRTLIRPPASRIGPVSAEERAELIRFSPIGTRYDKTVDRESAYEILTARAEAAMRAAQAAEAAEAEEKRARREERQASRGSNRQSVGEALLKSVARSVGTNVGRQIASSVGQHILRGILGSIFKGR